MSDAAEPSVRGDALARASGALLLVSLLSLLLLGGARSAGAHHEVAPCDLGGSAGGGEIGDPVCSLLDPPFTFGTWANIGSDGFSAGITDFARRKLVIETHAESTVPLQTIVSPLNAETEIAEASAYARTTPNDLQLGVYAKDLNDIPGDPFSSTREAAEAYAAVRYTVVSAQDDTIDLPITISGSFGGNSTTGRGQFQVSFRDFHGNLLGVVFATNNGAVLWREIICDDPANTECPGFTDHTTDWPGQIQRTPPRTWRHGPTSATASTSPRIRSRASGSCSPAARPTATRPRAPRRGRWSPRPEGRRSTAKTTWAARRRSSAPMVTRAWRGFGGFRGARACACSPRPSSAAAASRSRSPGP